MLCTEKNLSKQNHFQTEYFAQFRQVFDLCRSKLHRNFVHGTVKSVWFRKVFVYSGFSLDRSHCIYIVHAFPR